MPRPLRNHQTVRLNTEFLQEASRVAQVSARSLGGQVEYWARLGRALEASPAFSVAHVNAVLNGTMKIEELNALERAAFLEKLPDAFLEPSADLKAAYATLSKDSGTGTEPARTPARRRLAEQAR